MDRQLIRYILTRFLQWMLKISIESMELHLTNPLTRPDFLQPLAHGIHSYH